MTIKELQEDLKDYPEGLEIKFALGPNSNSYTVLSIYDAGNTLWIDIEEEEE